MSRPITFPKTGDGEWTNRETGVRISKHYEGHYRILAGNLPPSPSRAVGVHVTYHVFSQVLAAAKTYVAEVARPAIAAAHAEALEEDAQRDLDREREASNERIQAVLREARLGREGLDRQYTHAEAVAANRAITEAHEEALEMDAEHDKAWAYLDRLAADLTRTGGEVPPYAPYCDRTLREAHLAMVNRAHGEALTFDLATRGGAFNVRDVVTVSPLGGRQFEVVELDWDPTPTSLMVRVSPLNPTGLEDGLRWVPATYVRRVPADQIEPGPDEREADEQRQAWIERHGLTWHGISGLGHSVFEYRAAVEADHVAALEEEAAREQDARADRNVGDSARQYDAWRLRRANCYTPAARLLADHEEALELNAEHDIEDARWSRVSDRCETCEGPLASDGVCADDSCGDDDEAPYEYDRQAVNGRARLYPGPF